MQKQGFDTARGLRVMVLAASLALPGCAVLNAEKNAPPLGQSVAVEHQHMQALVEGGAHADAGPTIVLIHGASANLRDMKIALGDNLAQSRRVVMIDRPGRGYSTRPPHGYELGVQARYIHETLEKLGVEKSVIVGQSLGGAVALRYALDYPNDTTGLVLLAPVTHPFNTGVAWYQQVSAWPVLGFIFREAVVPIYGPLVGPKSVAHSFAPNSPPPNYYGDSGLALLFRPKDFKANAADIDHLSAELARQAPRYASIRVPTVIFAGENDGTVSPQNNAERLAKEVPGASLTLLPHTGHALHHAEAARISAAILAVGTGAP